MKSRTGGSSSAGALILGGMAYHLVAQHRRKQAAKTHPLPIIE